ncbi:peptidase m56 1 [Leptolyngbya sp. Heron Island J]|uniref:M56 family metallopeptidase n=1 Tax=Leptolyngbya sp. Heron Island J TaxID=1385935 RepID=UPI0003B970B8|nr:M56 family metallopeptidase [Leptolyngbya sp. Heron Island J]ESA32913.1 peptidase m56 1 [Leptolyngbya sp. Heron Island J]
MMHASLMASAIAIAVLLRLTLTHRCLQNAHWLAVLCLLVISPLLLLTTATAIVIMGPYGHVVGPLEGWFSYGIAWLFLLYSLGLLGYLSWQAHRSIAYIQHYPQQIVQGTLSRIMDESTVFSAQMGLWSSELVISQGLLDTLDQEHLTAVIAHEQAHQYYHDTFWFFWLGWLRRLTSWLPYTDKLWQELLLLREIRADNWATRSVDRLTLAESLVQVIAAPLSPLTVANFSCTAPSSRLSRRIDALLLDDDHDYGFQPRWSLITYGCIIGLVLGLIPLGSIPFHH